MRLKDIIQHNLVLTQIGLENQELLQEVQQLLSELGLYHGEIDGLWHINMLEAMYEFCSRYELNCMKRGQYGSEFARILLNATATKV